MGSLQYDELKQKFDMLPEQGKKEAFNFIEFLAMKSQQKKQTDKKKRKVKKSSIDKKKILTEMSYWEKEDIQNVNEARKHLNKWQPKTF